MTPTSAVGSVTVCSAGDWWWSSVAPGAGEDRWPVIGRVTPINQRSRFLRQWLPPVAAESSLTHVTEQPRTPVTIYDVAKAAGVAPSTVSRTFARPGRVNAETAARIRQVAEDTRLPRQPDRPGAAPRRRPTCSALMVSDVANPFYAQLIRGAQIAATEAGYEILLADCRESGPRERAALERLVPVVEGFVIGSSRMSDSALRTIAKQRPDGRAEPGAARRPQRDHRQRRRHARRRRPAARRSATSR